MCPEMVDHFKLNSIDLAASKKTVPVRFAKSLLLSAQRKGCDVNNLLDSLGFTFNPLDPESDTQPGLSALLYSKLLQQVTLVSQGHFFGLPVNKDGPGGGFRMMCLSIVHCKNLEDAIIRASEFYTLFGDPAWRFKLEKDDGHAVVRFTQAAATSLYAYDIMIWCRFLAWLTGQYIELSEVNLTEHMATIPNKYYKLFDCDVNFDETHNSIKFDQRYLDNPIVHTEDSLEEFLSTAPYQLIVIPKENSDSLASKIRYIVGYDFTKGFPSYKNISDILHISSTTLRRKLVKEGTTYQQIKDNTLRDAAIAYLSRPELTINNIGYLMGFIEPSAFNRTFKRWTGVPPGVYRKHYLNISDSDKASDVGDRVDS